MMFAPSTATSGVLPRRCAHQKPAELERAGARTGYASRRLRDVTVAVGWDPENVLAGPQEGHIARRQYQKKVQADAAFLQSVRPFSA